MKRHTQNREEQLDMLRDETPNQPVTFFITRLPDAIAQGANFESRKSYREHLSKAIPVQHSFGDDTNF